MIVLTNKKFKVVGAALSITSLQYIYNYVPRYRMSRQDVINLLTEMKNRDKRQKIIEERILY